MLVRYFPPRADIAKHFARKYRGDVVRLANVGNRPLPGPKQTTSRNRRRLDRRTGVGLRGRAEPLQWQPSGGTLTSGLPRAFFADQPKSYLGDTKT